MKTRILLVLIVAVILIMALESFVNAPFSFSSPFGYAGDPAGGGFNCKSCHSGPAPVTSKAGWISTNIPGTGYVPGTTYTITASATEAGHTKFGFEITPQNSSGTFLGTLANLNSETELYFDANMPRISHNNSGNLGAGSKTWMFTWTAPPAGSGQVTFYGMFNITNNDNSGQGDTIYSSKTTVAENTSVSVTELSPGSHTKVFPSLVTSQLHVEITLVKPELVEISLIDLQGRAAKLLPGAILPAGDHKQVFVVEGQYLSGFYFVKTSIGKKASLHKVYISS